MTIVASLRFLVVNRLCVGGARRIYYSLYRQLRVVVSLLGARCVGVSGTDVSDGVVCCS